MNPTELDKSSSNIGRRMALAASWTVGSRLVVRLLGLTSTIILARLLVPADYGLIALATLIAASIEMFGAFNFDVWIIRHPDPDRDHYDTVWTMTAIRGFLSCLVLLAFAVPASIFFDAPLLQDVVIVLAFNTLICDLGNVGTVDFRKHLRFDKEFQILAGSKFAGFLVAVTLAVILRNHWALVAGIVTAGLSKVIMSYWMHAYRPRISLRHWREILDFSKWLLFVSSMGFFYNRTDTFIFGKLLNNQALGIYTVAHEIANLASSEIVIPIRRVMLPGYSKLINDLDKLRESFADGLGVIMLIGLPCAAGVGLIADPLVRVLLGDKWLDTIPLIQILAVYGIASVGMANQSPLLIAMGHARIATRLLVLGFVVLVPTFTLATLEYGVLGGAWAVGLTNVMLLMISIYVTMRILDLPFKSVISRLWRSFIATTAMAVVVFSFSTLPQIQAWWAIAELLVGIVLGAVTYGLTILLLWVAAQRPLGPETITMDFISRRGKNTTIMPLSHND